MDLLLIAAILLFVAVPLFFAIWAIIDIARFDGAEPLVKTLWIFGVIIFPYVASLIWIFAGRRVISSTKQGTH